MTENLSKEEKKEKREAVIDKLLWLPIVLLITVVPLIMHVAIIYPDSVVVDVLNKTYVAEPYANYKATAMIILCVLMMFLLFFVFDKEKLKLDRTIKVYMIGVLLFLGVSLISTITSKYSQVAWGGMPDRAEGMLVIACYIFMMIYTIYSLSKMEQVNYLIGAMCVLVTAITVLGVFDYIGYSLFQNNSFFQNLMISSEAKALDVTEIINNFASGQIIATMMNYNYVGSFGAMIVPLFITLTLFVKGRWQKILCAVMSVCSMFILFGSTSRAGLIGLLASIIVGMIVFARIVIKKWKITVPIAVALMVILVGFNMITNGKIFSRVPTLLSDITLLFTSSNQAFDYREHIPVKEVSHENSREKIVFQTGTLYIENNESTPLFKDELGNIINYEMNAEEGILKTTDERFSHATFVYSEVIKAEKSEIAPVILRLTVDHIPAFYFRLDGEKGVTLVDTCPIEEEEIEYPETWGFEGKERIGSARGYIWSRSIPLMKDTLLIGNGPDTFALEFPQQDYLGKWYAYGTPHMIVDKAHSLYLDIFINSGGLALLGFLMIVGTYIVQAFKLYTFKGYYEDKEIVGIAMFLAVIGYLGAGIFNDSVVPVAPIFWILLGAGIAINFMVSKEQIEMKKRTNKIISITR